MSMSMKRTTRDNILYVAIACTIVGALLLRWWYQEAHGLPLTMPFSVARFELVFSTTVIFGYAIKENRQAWKRTRFWIVVAVTFAVFVPLQWLLIQHITLNLITFGFATAMEFLGLLIVLEKLGCLQDCHER